MKGHFTPHTKQGKINISLGRSGKGLGNKNGFKKGQIPWLKGTKGLGKGGVKKGNIPWNKGKGKPIVYKPKVKRVGELSGNWQGGITSINSRIRNSPEYTDWRIKVFQRDDYTCQECGSRGVTLHADHIKPFAYYPELRLVIENGRTLCVPCHKKTPTFAGRAKRFLLNNTQVQ